MNHINLKFFLENIFIFLISFCSYRIFIPIFKKYILDLPNYRSSHGSPKPTSGGILFSFIICISSFSNGSIYPFICFPLAIVGFIDDIINLNPKIRYLSQVLIVITLITQSNILENINIPSFLNIYFLIFLLIILLTGIINFTNFMDGIDGLVAGCMIVIFIFYSIKSNFLFFSVIPCLAAFLLFNWSPAKIFMGDSGSTFLGSLFVCLLLTSTNYEDLVYLMTISSPIFLDAFTCVIRRFKYKQNIFGAHNSHLYQRLVKAGYSHGLVSSIYIFTTILLVILTLYYNTIYVGFSTLLVALFGLFLDFYCSEPFEKTIENSNKKFY